MAAPLTAKKNICVVVQSFIRQESEVRDIWKMHLDNLIVYLDKLGIINYHA